MNAPTFLPAVSAKKLNKKKKKLAVCWKSLLLLLSRVHSLSHSLRAAENTEGLYKISRKRVGGEGEREEKPAGTATMDSSRVLNVKTNHLSMSNRSVLFFFCESTL